MNFIFDIFLNKLSSSRYSVALWHQGNGGIETNKIVYAIE